MKIFIDSADIDEIEEAVSLGIIDGVTTNPSLIKEAIEKRKKKGGDYDLDSYIRKILMLMKGKPVSLEVVGHNYTTMLREAMLLHKKYNSIANNVVIKIPINSSLDGETNYIDGLKVISELSELGIPVNCTLIFSPEQALLAARAGAIFVSPFVGRFDDFIREKNKIKFKKEDYFPAGGLLKGNKYLEDNGLVSGVDLIEKCSEILCNSELKTEIIAASIRNPRQLREVALAKANIVTLPLDVIKKSLSHEKTKEGMKKFIKDSIKEYASVMEK